ncbi:5'/3'-nucleotidase SurE [Ectothiorhodospira lacustris]|uniref:5'/3'-nucleotidase SurE n=1 Tax=Ectothiorhodospira lacustris TaxID=2899127 RepID=UPI001EE79E0A|nr:5'/3'-nucleotidase SurE [Ectothiorhodospira lacustris]MCG5500310.1 5'/3'-nucleotidase SurE [Ectothiorhodospira lacustris]MCG5510106.1 5'/3'-nucleotidase SurE [Ectothiorhodospira lacustris]MCG5521949.1 5'/3'-nucleotidase SurE [Ectothiorhodospira lacustris]
MRILLSNDDGVHAQGLQTLAKALRTCAQVHVVAPDRDRSGASNSLTLSRPLRPETLDSGDVRVDGTPTDCVHLAITGLLEEEPDMVISGINSGANLGDDVLYSGTVAAAMEGRFLGLPAIAVSLAGYPCQHFDSAARAVMQLLERLRNMPLPSDTILNVNVPNLPWGEIRGFQTTRLGHRHKAEPVTRATDPRGRPIYWVGPAGPEQDAGPGTDFHAIRSGYVSVTPIQVDLTRYDAMDVVSRWLTGEQA